MTAFVQTAQTIINGTWDLLSGVVVPGLGGIHFSALYFGIFLIGIAIMIMRRMLGKKEDDRN